MAPIKPRIPSRIEVMPTHEQRYSFPGKSSRKGNIGERDVKSAESTNTSVAASTMVCQKRMSSGEAHKEGIFWNLQQLQ
jgi:hypothetical protein